VPSTLACFSLHVDLIKARCRRLACCSAHSTAMANDSPASYQQVSTRDEEDNEVISLESIHSAQEHGSGQPQRPTTLAQLSSAPSVVLSPPIRADTADSYLSATSQPTARKFKISLARVQALITRQVSPQNDEKRPDGRRHSSLTVLRDRFQGSFTPSLHELLEKQPPSPAARREYSHKRQRNRLWRLTIGEFILTLAICLAYFGVLYAYSKKPFINVAQRRRFNALTTGIALLLGVNLAASLRSYAKLLRWRMLAICYRPLETFDLVMGCDSLMNVTKLLWKARDHKHRWLPSRTQILCALWLLVHLAVTILVGIIGLNYNLDNSADYVLLKSGNTSILNLDALSSGNYPFDLAGVQTWGISGVNSQALDPSVDVLETQESYFTDHNGWTMYYVSLLPSSVMGQHGPQCLGVASLSAFFCETPARSGISSNAFTVSGSKPSGHQPAAVAYAQRDSSPSILQVSDSFFDFRAV
jgi:hypothetical protein